MTSKAIILGLLLLGSLILALSLGTTVIWPHQWPGLALDPSLPEALILRELRLPRAAASFLVGASLGLAGLIFQGIFKNPLAEPYLLGSASGASIGATLAILLPSSIPLTLSLPVFSFLGALAASLIVISFAFLAVARWSQGILLAGVALAAILTAIRSMILLTFAEPGSNLQVVMSWMMGGIQVRGNADLLALSILTLAGFALTYRLHRGLDLLSFGEDLAFTMGLKVNRFMISSILVASLLTGVAISWGGVIGVIGLVAPHICRWWIGPAHRNLVLATPIVGGTLILFLDGWARFLLAPSEIPIGLLTAIAGGPFFLFLLWKLNRP